ncbi:alpha/beta fold hydrolase [Rhodococcus kronopolitis]|uniref:Alpha/beta fold hydrolase n=1 Tax=Rhodococcus kronopolitis TaxID=1460226 RepID=A0ABV9FSR5_9NOCA
MAQTVPMCRPRPHPHALRSRPLTAAPAPSPPVTETGTAAARLAWHEARVDGEQVSYASAGAGRAVVFLHGWGLTHRTYGRALEHLAGRGVKVLAPALPGLGGTPELPLEQRNLAGYARWLGRFLAAAGVRGPVTLVGHSFGGGVAAQAAHDLPGRVEGLILVNSVGGAAWTDGPAGVRPIADRPLWSWGAAATSDVLAVRPTATGFAAVAVDALRNVMRSPGAFWRTAHLARTADLSDELDELAARGLPVTLLWGRGDTVIPRASFESLRARLHHAAVVTVPGHHGWLIDDPVRFGDAMAEVLASSGVDVEVTA